MKRFKARQIYLLFILILSGFLITGCGSGGGEVTEHWAPARTLTSIRVTPVTAAIPVLGIYPFTATAIYSDGSSIDVTASSAWSSSDHAVAANPINGWATGLKSGTTNITATFGGMTSNTAVLTVNTATLMKIMVAPATASIPVLGTYQFMATAIYTDGSTIDVTGPGASWISSNHTVALNPSNGLATGLTAGTSNITATFGGMTSNTAILTVNAKALLSIMVTPALASIPVLGTQQYKALAIYNDGSTLDVTTNPGITWASATHAVAANPINGLATGLTAGTSNITATFGGMTSNIAVLTVNNKILMSLDVTPALASIPVLGTQQYKALAIYNDGSTLDVTTNVNNNWASDTLAVADVGLHTGVARGNVVGQSNITATFGGMTSNIAVLTVNDKILMSLDVTPALASIPVLGTQQYKALAIYNDGSTLDVTTNILTLWQATDVVVGTGVATVDSTGSATGNAPGQSTIRATYLTKTDFEILTVTPPTPGPAGAAVDLGTASTYGIIASTAMTIPSSDLVHIYGDVAITATDAFTGFALTGTIPLPVSVYVTPKTTPGINSTVHGDTAAIPQLKIDLLAAYNYLMGRVPAANALTTIESAVGKGGGTFLAGNTDLSGFVLEPGVYKFGAATAGDTIGLSNAALGPLVLDAKGNPDAVFVFQASDITMTTNSVILQGGAQPKNVFWVMTATANIGNGVVNIFQGTVVAGTAITVNGTNVEGRMLAGATIGGPLTITAAGSTITVPE